MRWTRCLHCRTLCDRDQAPACPGCGAEIPDTLDLAPRKPPRVEGDAARDLRATGSGIGIVGVTLLVSTGAVALLGTFNPRSMGPLSLLGILLFAAAVIGIVTFRMIPGPGKKTMSCLQGCFVAVGLIAGIVILVFMMCVSSF